MPNGEVKSLKIGFRFAIDQDIARLDNQHNPFEKTLQLTDIEQERQVKYKQQISAIREQWNTSNDNTKRLYWRLYESKSDDDVVEMLLRRDRRCGWYLIPDPNGTTHALEEYEPQSKELEMWNQTLYKHVIYARNKTHRKALMGIDVFDRAKQSVANFMNNWKEYKDLEPEEKEKLSQYLKSCSDVDQEIVRVVLQVIYKE
jgi:hypothetical protein